MHPTCHVIVNPISGGGAARRFLPRLRRTLEQDGRALVVTETSGAGHASDLARRAVDARAETVVAVGGDGTVHEVVNGLLAAPVRPPADRPALALVPLGTGNDFAKVLGIGDSADRALVALARGTVRLVDVGRAEWDERAEYFVNAMGAGVDVEVVRQIARLPHMPGAARYLLGLARALLRFEPLRLRISLEGRPADQSVMIAAVGNGTCQGGGFHMFPRARPDDGLLDVCLVREAGLPRIIRTVLAVLRGRHLSVPGVAYETAAMIEIEALEEGPLCFQLDGELREALGRRVSIRVERRALRVLTFDQTGGGQA